MGEETVQSIREGGVASVEPESVMESMARGAAKSCAGSTMSVRVVDSGVEVCTMSVTGRMVGIGAAVLTTSTTGGVEESAEGVGSMGGWGVGEGETEMGLGGVGEGGDISLTQGEVESICGSWESMTGGSGESLDADSSTISNWMGMSECGLMEGGGSVVMLQSVIGTGEGVGDGGRLSCIDGVGEPANVTWASSGKGTSNFGVIPSMSLASRSGDSNVMLGGGSMMGVVQINKEAGTVPQGAEGSAEGAGAAADSFVGEGPMLFISGTAESVSGSTGSETVAGGSSAPAKSGSVTHGLCKGVEDSRCSLLACMTPSLPRAVVGEDDTE